MEVKELRVGSLTMRGLWTSIMFFTDKKDSTLHLPPYTTKPQSPRQTTPRHHDNTDLRLGTNLLHGISHLPRRLSQCNLAKPSSIDLPNCHVKPTKPRPLRTRIVVTYNHPERQDTADETHRNPTPSAACKARLRLEPSTVAKALSIVRPSDLQG